MIEVKDTGAAREMPRYQCHKRVWALKIAAIEFLSGTAKIAFVDERYAPISVPGYRAKFHAAAPLHSLPADVDLGYYVQYADGYISWSPTKAFEEGYTRLN